ncbi:MAG: ribonuclease HI family protein [Acidobacteriaceae bacterium]
MTDAAHGGEIVAYCDGGSRGNPGPSGYGVSIEDAAGRPIAGLSEFLGVKTNNFAEYSGLLAALEYALSHAHPRLRVVADSELMVKQMKGQYQVKSPDLRPLWEEAKRRAARLERFEIQHVLRSKNKRADALANEAMDRGTGKTVREVARESDGSAAPSAPLPRIAASVVRPAKPAEKRVLKGFVKNGVVHLLEGELPENCFVRVTPE